MKVPDEGDAAPSERHLMAARLKEVVRSKGGNAAVAKASGLSESTLNKWLAGAEPGALNLRKVADATGVSLDYLVGRSSEHPSKSGTDQLITNVYGLKPSRRSDDVPEGFVPIPQLDVQASAGNGRLVTEDETSYIMLLRESWLRSLGVLPRNAQLLTATGDSMEPTIRDGDLLLVDRGINQVVDNGIYIVVVSGLVLVKRLQSRVDGSLTLLSDNRDRYEAETIGKDRIHELTIEGRVKWYGRSI